MTVAASAPGNDGASVLGRSDALDVGDVADGLGMLGDGLVADVVLGAALLWSGPLGRCIKRMTTQMTAAASAATSTTMTVFRPRDDGAGLSLMRAP